MTRAREDLAHRLRGLAPEDVGLRSFVVTSIASVCQVVTILATWGLWHGRTQPANLPLVDALAGVNWGLPLLILAVVSIVRPRFGGPAFATVYLVAVLGDQIRIQPEVISLVLLMSVPAFGASGRAVARWQLAAMWFWAGLNKALSLGWASTGATFVATSLHAPSARPAIAVVLPTIEIALGLLALWPRAWRGVAVGGLALHLGIFVTLSPVLGDVNSSVWAWNLGLGAISFVLFWTPAPEPLLPTTGVRVAALVLVVTPALFYGGLIDAYLAHNLYTYNTATAVVCADRGGCATESFSTFGTLNAAFPPEERLYRDAFLADCSTDTYLDVTGPRTRLVVTPQVTRYRCRRTVDGPMGRP